MPIVKMLDLSTAHVEVTSETEMRPKWQDGRVISEPVPDFGSLEAWSREGGWLLPVVVPGSGTPPWLVPILDYAWNNGCFYVNFDMDADIDEQFQTYDW